jgi:alpha-N-arabinofuranosidase
VVKHVIIGLFALVVSIAQAGEYHVSVNGDDTHDGSAAAPLRSIMAAARLAQPGDVITVHEGVYRERISPPRGGDSDGRRITYQAAPGEKVFIKGSEVIKGWEKVQNDTWKVAIPNSFFKDFNPYNDLIHGDWFNPKGREHHTGAVYLKGDWLIEAARQEQVLEPVGAAPLWFGKVDASNTTIWAQFKGIDPNQADVEINVRRTVFYPEKTGVNYLTVRGFAMMHAATPWAPPTAEQIGLLGTNWSKGWIIENNDVSYSACAGIALGKHGDQYDNTSQDTAEGYVKTIERGLARGWSRDNIGHHIVRNNHVSHCEQAGIVGSLGPIFCTVTGNEIHDIHVRLLFGGAEMAGIKFHGAIDTEISRNHIYRTCRGIWLDWMAQGTRVTCNLLHDNGPSEDLFVEVDHGPFLVDNNVFLSPTSLLDMSEGGAFVHNLFVGRVVPRPELSRETPFHKAHSTEVAGLVNIKGGDHRYYNNLFVGGTGLVEYDKAAQPVFMAGNVFVKGAAPCKAEQSPIAAADFDPVVKLTQSGETVTFRIATDKAWLDKQSHPLVTTELLGKAKIPSLPYEQPDGLPYRLGTDYFGKERNAANPFPGPFELPAGGKQELKLWPAGQSR